MHAPLDSRSLRLACAALVVGVALALAPARAQAQADDDWELHFGAEYYVLATAASVGVLGGIGFLVTDSVFAAQGHCLPPWAAGLELALAGVPWLLVGGMMFGLDDANHALGALGLLIGTAFSVHAVASLALYDPSPPRSHERELTSGPHGGRGWHVAPWLAPRIAGASMFGRF